MTSTWILAGGAISGFGLLLLSVILFPGRVQPASALAELDSLRGEDRLRQDARRLAPAGAEDSAWTEMIGLRASTLLRRMGVDTSGLSSDLAVTTRSMEQHLALSVLTGLAGLMAPLVLSGLAIAAGLGSSLSTPALVAVILGLVCAMLPTLRLRRAAEEGRRNFRHVVGSFLDLVSMSLAAGRGVPEALDAASRLSDDPSMIRLRDAFATARLRGESPWVAMGRLGEELRIDELRDLAAALALVSEDGAKIRESLAARAGSMRRRELAEAEGRAGQNSESMLVAQLILALGFIVFLVYPSIMGILVSS